MNIRAATNREERKLEEQLKEGLRGHPNPANEGHLKTGQR